MADTDRRVVLIAHANGLLGEGLTTCLQPLVQAPVHCVAVSALVQDPTRAHRAGVVILECPDEDLDLTLRQLIAPVPIINITGVVRGAQEGAPPDLNGLASQVQSAMSAA